ncbi:protein translocase subunit secF [Litorimonas taeanensis]|uniref:Protein-export membrane protein SecF n=1 Tax=Litorimonas taeanensis TaxID=568099 RepID=A0A420WKF2_9PROT|nr:protein translocase subunit SecF [Litorimonas taeanensis]RKQ71531.1 protein translocase subunit secF [Litorimonas taeanensis]
MKDISLVRFLPKEPKVPFINLRMIAGALSVLAIIASIFLFTTRGLNYGIDFTGGTVIEIDTGGEPDLAEIRSVMADAGFPGATVQGIAPSTTAIKPHDLVRIGIPLQPESDETGATAQQEAMQKAQAALVENIEGFVVPDGIRSQESVGSQVSGELRTKGALAVGLALFMVLAYIWFRFEWQFGLGAVLALFHDVILTIGIFSLTQIEFNLSIIAAILTIVGYSLNDTVIVYDRVRENLRKYKKMPMPDVLNLSINDTLSRTILTSFTTLLALFALYFLGGDGLRGFSFAMIWGVFVGTYSSIFVASPLLILLNLKRGVNTGNAQEA